MKVCVITARAGSKRIPGKNIRPFAGKPMLHHAIERARESGVFDEIVVSTESEDIATCAHLAGIATVIKRPANLADDVATTAQVMKHAVEELEHAALHTDLVCCLYPCTPLVKDEDLDRGIRILLSDPGHAYAMPVARYRPAVQRSLRLTKNRTVIVDWPEFACIRTQDLGVHYYDPGQWYWGRADAWRREIQIYGQWTAAVEIPRTRAVDIDDEEDWQIAEALYAYAPRRCKAPGGACDQTNCSTTGKCAWEGR